MSVAASQAGSKNTRSAVIWGLVLLVPLLGTVAVLASQGSLQAVTGPYGQFTADTPAGELVAGAAVGQTFTADQAGLYRIDVYLGNYQRQNHGSLVLHVKAAPFLQADMAVAWADASQVRADGFLSFEFKPLPTPAGVPLCFLLEAPQGSVGNAVTALGTARDTYAGGAALLEKLPGTRDVQDLAFRLYYRPGARQALATLIARQVAGRPSIFGTPQLYQALIAAYLIGLGCLVVLAVSQLSRG